MARNLLTALEIKNSTKPKLRDGEGLWLHTSKAGNRYWVFIYVRHGRRREMGLGPLANVSLATARAKATEAREIIHRGGDPFKEMTDRQVLVMPKTFGECADEYIESMRPKWRSKKTLDGWLRFAAVDAKFLRKIPVGDVSTDDVVRCVRPNWQTKQRTAKKTLDCIALVLDYAKALKLRIGDNPAEWRGHVEKILPKPGKSKHHPALPFVEVPAFMQKLRATDGIAARALEFTILTASRNGEARGATWDEIDLDGKLWTVPASRMKSKRDHRVPLSGRAVAILKEMKSKRLGDFVFPGRIGGSIIADTSLADVLQTIGGNGFTVHGFRSSFRDWVSEETSHQREVAEAALAHAVGDVVERSYRRGDALEKRRALMSDWAAYCTK